MDADHIIEVSGLRKSFGATQVLDGIDFAVERASVFALLGPNGAGKTTTVHILSTLIRPDGGTVRIDGHATDPRRHRVGIAQRGAQAA